MCESIVVVGAALSADVDAPTERVHSAPGARRGQSPKQPRANVLAVRTPRSFASGATETAETRPSRRVSDQPRGEFSACSRPRRSFTKGC